MLSGLVPRPLLRGGLTLAVTASALRAAPRLAVDGLPLRVVVTTLLARTTAATGTGTTTESRAATVAIALVAPTIGTSPPSRSALRYLGRLTKSALATATVMLRTIARTAARMVLTATIVRVSNTSEPRSNEADCPADKKVTDRDRHMETPPPVPTHDDLDIAE